VTTIVSRVAQHFGRYAQLQAYLAHAAAMKVSLGATVLLHTRCVRRDLLRAVSHRPVDLHRADLVARDLQTSSVVLRQPTVEPVRWTISGIFSPSVCMWHGQPD